MVKRERHVVNGKDPLHTPFHFLSVCDDEPSTKALQVAVIQDHLRVLTRPAVQCGTLRTSAAQNTSVRIADDSPLLCWLPRLCSARHEQNEDRQRRKNE